MDNLKLSDHNKAEVVILRPEWFGGFAFDWRDSHIREFNRVDFAALAAHQNSKTLLINPQCEIYMPFPVRVSIDVSYMCNRQCLYCYSDSGPFRYKERYNELKADEICKIIDGLASMGVLALTFTGGEPLLKDGIWEVLTHAGSLSSLFSSVVTNGSLLSTEIADRFRSTGIKNVCISLDGKTETNDVQRWAGSYNEAMNAIRLLLEANIRLTVISVVTKYTAPHFTDFVDTLYNTGVRSHQVHLVADTGRSKDNWLGMNDKECLEFSAIMEALRSRMSTCGYQLMFNDALLARGQKPERLPIYAFSDAVPGWKCNIRANGDVIYDRLWGPAYQLGNIRQKSIQEIWISSELQRKEHIQVAYQMIHSHKMLTTYVRLKPEISNDWHWLASLDNYYMR